MAEYVICYILMHERNALQCLASQQRKQWKMPRPGLLRGKRLGIMGVGSIGTAIAEAAKFFKMHTSGYARSPSPRAFIDQMFGADQLLEFVGDLDYLISVLPDTPYTTHLINSSVFNAMKPEAVLINVGRGNAVDENALVEALNSKEIAGAVLDVFQEEPLPKAHALWETKGVIVTSHKAALSYPEDIAPLFIDNYRRFAAGSPLKYLVDFAKGY
jgi:phosphoglycerate dehydrogenase-like enzyme